MKKIIKYIKILILLLVLNQVIILIFSSFIREGWWKTNSTNRFNEYEALKFTTSNLKWNLIEENEEICGVVQLYIGKKLVISNLTMTEWYVYEHK